MTNTAGGPNTLSLLALLPLLAGLAERELAELANLARINHFGREATLFRQGDPADRFWLLSQGRIKIIHQSEDGRDVILEMISPGEVFGGAVLFMPVHPASAQTMTEVETLSFSSAVYAGLIRAHPEIAQKLIGMLGARLHSLMGLQVLAGERVERRLAHILLRLADRAGRAEPGGGVLITIPLSRQDLADMAGTTLETAIRTMSRLRDQGMVETQRGGYIAIRDLEQLRRQVGT
jgi:CRP-like cAMP-binding protein